MLNKAILTLRDAEPICALDPLLLIPRIEYVEDVLSLICRSETEIYSLVILDMKNFHLINDIFDYNTGDEVLFDFLLQLRSRLPEGSISLRFRHGDEFLFFVPLSPDKSNQLFSDFNAYCEQYSFLKKPDGDDFIISFRFACLSINKQNADTKKLLSIAEFKLREVKGQGSARNL